MIHLLRLLIAVLRGLGVAFTIGMVRSAGAPDHPECRPHRRAGRQLPVELGSHAELLALDGLYALLHRMQFKLEESPEPGTPGEAEKPETAGKPRRPFDLISGLTRG